MKLSTTQEKAFACGKALLSYYREISPEHADVTVNLSTIAGDLIADIQYTMSHVYEYPEMDIESVRLVALINSLKV